MRVELELRNLPSERVMGYLMQAGGQRQDERHVTGQGWAAVLEPMEAANVGMFHIPRDLLVIEGEPAIVEVVHAFMRRQTMRGGG